MKKNIMIWEKRLHFARKIKKKYGWCGVGLPFSPFWTLISFRNSIISLTLTFQGSLKQYLSYSTNYVVEMGKFLLDFQLLNFFSSLLKRISNFSR